MHNRQTNSQTDNMYWRMNGYLINDTTTMPFHTHVYLTKKHALTHTLSHNPSHTVMIDLTPEPQKRVNLKLIIIIQVERNWPMAWCRSEQIDGDGWGGGGGVIQ